MNVKGISDKSQVCQKKDVYLTELDEDRVMMDLDTGNYYVLNSMGSMIWDKLREKIGVGELIEQLLREYKVEPDTCKQEVMTYLSELQQINLVVVEN